MIFKRFYNRDKYKKKHCILTQCACLKECTDASDVTYAELLKNTLKAIKHRLFHKRLNQYIKESEMNPMLYKDNDHKETFQKALLQRPNADAAMLSALYLLTADRYLWSKVRPAVGSSVIAFGVIKLGNISTDGYTMFITAKDLCYGSKHITVSDLADKEIVPSKLFRILCNAIAIRRYGKKAIEIAERN